MELPLIGYPVRRKRRLPGRFHTSEHTLSSLRQELRLRVGITHVLTGAVNVLAQPFKFFVGRVQKNVGRPHTTFVQERAHPALFLLVSHASEALLELAHDLGERLHHATGIVGRNT